MTTATINTGTTANDGTGDALRTAFTKTNAVASLATMGAGLQRAMKLCTFGSSHCTADFGFGVALQYSLARYHNADLYFRHRGVLTSVADPTVIANRGDSYATPTADSAHTVGAQLTQFNTDVAAGMRFDILVTDIGLYNDNPSTQANLDTALARLNTLMTAFFDPAGNNGTVFIIWGMFGKSPTICAAWANMCRFLESTSNGRVRFVDVAAVVADPTNASGSTWAWRGGAAVFGGTSHDGTHLSENGARRAALPLSYVLKDACPRVFVWPGSFANSTYDPANMRWANILQDGAAMIGTSGLDNGASVPGTVPGTGSSGFNNRWNIGSTGSLTRGDAIGTSANGDKQFQLTLGGSTGGGDYYEYSFQSQVTNVNNSVATRKYMCGIEVELVGVTGLSSFFIKQANAATWNTPGGSAQLADGWADTTSETLLLRSMCPVAWSGNNPNFDLFMFFRNKNPVAGQINLRRAFLVQVEE